MPRSDVHVEFFMRAVPDPKRSADLGRPVSKDVEYCRIRFPGDKHRLIEQPAHSLHRWDRESGRHLTYAEGFPEHYEAFKAGLQVVVDGTPLSEAPFLTEAQRADLRAFNVHTVEQLAGMGRSAMKKFGMDANELVAAAKAYLERASDAANATKLARENAALQDRIAQMETMMREMQAERAHDEVEAA